MLGSDEDKLRGPNIDDAYLVFLTKPFSPDELLFHAGAIRPR
jgi:hypothetical protein